MLQWAIDKDPSDDDYFAVIVDDKWLGDNDIDSATFHVEQRSGLSVSDVSISGAECRAKISGGNIGTHFVIVTIRSNGRTRQRTVTLKVKQM